MGSVLSSQGAAVAHSHVEKNTSTQRSNKQLKTGWSFWFKDKYSYDFKVDLSL